MKTIGIIGTRRRNSLLDYREVRSAFNEVHQVGDIICSGLCPKGADRFAVLIADELKLSSDKRLWFPAEWHKHGKAAGFIRNTDIAKNSDVLIACVAEDRLGGTEDTIKKWKKFHPSKEPILV